MKKFPSLGVPTWRKTGRGRIPRWSRSRGGWAFLILIVLLVLARVLRSGHQSTPVSSDSPPPAREGIVAVERVVDGDTIRLVGGETVRLIGVDAPESVKPLSPVEPYGPEASAFLETLIREHGYRVRLEFDTRLRDKYGRLLAYVWAGDKLLNEEIIRAGLARAEMQYSYDPVMKERFRLAEAQAQLAGRGIWSHKR